MTPRMYEAKDYEIYIGNDVDKRSFSLTIRDRYKPLMTKSMPAQPEALHNFITNHFRGKRVIVGYESGPTGYGLHDYLNDHELTCVVIPPSSIPRASGQRVKTNRIDSAKLAALLCDGEFKPVRVPRGDYRELRHMVIMRENYVKDARAAKQRIKGLMLYTGLEETCRDIDQNWSNRYLEHLGKVECSPAVRLRLNMLLEDLKYGRQRILNVLKGLKELCKNNVEIGEYIRYLRSIPGIGFVIATSVLGRIGDPQHLRNVRELSAFIGLVPREHSTGERIQRGAITHMGNGKLRSLLVEAAWIAIQYDKELEKFYNRIKNKHHALYGGRKAVVAVAHKLTLRIYRVLKEHREYIVR